MYCTVLYCTILAMHWSGDEAGGVRSQKSRHWFYCMLSFRLRSGEGGGGCPCMYPANEHRSCMYCTPHAAVDYPEKLHIIGSFLRGNPKSGGWMAG